MSIWSRKSNRCPKTVMVDKNDMDPKTGQMGPQKMMGVLKQIKLVGKSDGILKQLQC